MQSLKYLLLLRVTVGVGVEDQVHGEWIVCHLHLKAEIGKYGRKKDGSELSL